MPCPDFTDISVVLDRSGSMEDVRDDTIGGFNTFLKDQKATPGMAALTLVQFDSEYEIVHAGKPIAEIPRLTKHTFVPRGSTALLDAIGRTINATGARLAAMPESERPGKVVFVILTDGQENASREFNLGMIHAMISHQSNVYKWQFLFLGANQDAIEAGGLMGVTAANAMTYAANAMGTPAAFRATSKRVARFRNRGGILTGLHRRGPRGTARSRREVLTPADQR